jgi:hypothetical protein
MLQGQWHSAASLPATTSQEILVPFDRNHRTRKQQTEYNQKAKAAVSRYLRERREAARAARPAQTQKDR